MRAIHPIRAGVTLAVLIGGWHAVWAGLVAFGWAQPIIDFVFWMHFIKPVYVVGSFNLGIALILIGVTTVVGFLVGYVFGFVWNRLHPS
jgi:hypothetical protein